MTRFLAFDYLPGVMNIWMIYLNVTMIFSCELLYSQVDVTMTSKKIPIWTYALCCRLLDNEELPDIILLCKMIVFCDLIKINIIRLITKPRPDTWCNLRSCDIAWRRGIWQNILAAREFCAFDSPWILIGLIWASHKPNTKFKRKFSLDLDCFETRRNTDDAFEKNIFQILTKRKANLVLFFTISISQLFQKKRNTMNQF